MNCLDKTLKKIDIFGQPIRLQINGNETVRTILGGILTICLFLLIAVTFGVYSEDAFFKLNPQIITTTDYTDDAWKMITLNQTYFKFKIGSASIINTTPYLTIATADFNSIFNISNCKNDDPYFETLPHYNGSILTNNWYCMDLSDYTEPLEFFTFDITYCTGESYCKSREEINSFFSNDVISIDYYFDGLIIDPSKYTHPISLHSKNYRTWLRSNTYIWDVLRFTPHKLMTDDSMIYSNKHNFNDANEIFPIFDDQQEIRIAPNNCIDQGKITCNLLAKISLKSYRKIITYERTYKRISDSLANVGGLTSLLFRVITMMMEIYCTFIRDEKIANHIYDFGFEEDQQSTIDKECIKLSIKKNNDKNNNLNASHNIQISDTARVNKPKISQLMNITISSLEKRRSDLNNEQVVSNHLSENTCSNMNQPESKSEVQLISLDKIILKRNQKNHKFKFIHLLVYYACSYCCKKDSNLKKKYETHQKVKNAIKNVLDIKRIINQTEGFENLKMILLNNEQYALLNFITKNNLNDSYKCSGKKKNNKYITRKNFLENEENLRCLVNDVFVKLKNTHNSFDLDAITSKLVDYIDINLLDKRCSI